MKRFIGQHAGRLSVVLALLAPSTVCAQSTQTRSPPETAQFRVPAQPDLVVDFPDNVEGRLELPYLQRSGYRPLTLDLYRKRDAAGRLPIVIYIHGGSLTAGDSRGPTPAVRAGMGAFAAMLAARGYAAVSVNYRLVGEALLPAAILDIKASIRWLRANADKYNLDPARIAIFGDSAGGGLAAIVGTSCNVAQFNEKYPPAMGRAEADLANYSDCVNAVSEWYGVIDMGQLDSMAATTREVKSALIHNSPTSSQSRALGCVLGSTCSNEIIQDNNPIHFLDDSDRKTSFLIMHGTHDAAVSYKQAQLFYDALRARNIPAQLVLVPGVDHYFAGADAQQIGMVEREFLGFLDRTVGQGAKR